MKICFVARADMFAKRGGDTILCELYAGMAKASGWETSFWLGGKDFEEADLYHAFNIDRPLEIFPMLRQVVEQGGKYVITTLHHPWEWVERFRVDALGVGPIGRMFYKSPLGSRTRRAEHFKELVRMVITRSYFDGVFHVSWLNRTRWILENASGVFLQSAKEQEYIETDFGVFDLGARAVVLPNPAAEDDVRAKQVCGEEVDVLFVGRIEARKNPLSLVHAAVASNKSLLMIGRPNPNEKAYFETVLNLVDKHDNVTLVQGVSRAELQQYYNRSKLLVNPSYVEVSPIVDVEALANDCPLVTTRYALHHEFLPAGVGSCDPYSIGSLIEAIQETHVVAGPANIPREADIRQELMRVYGCVVGAAREKRLGA